jgi:hypothetical protein
MILAYEIDFDFVKNETIKMILILIATLSIIIFTILEYFYYPRK